MIQWDYLLDGYKCPVCKKNFKDEDACPHSWADVEKRNFENHVRQIFRKMLGSAGEQI